ncbi:glycosyltransferase [Candidatus Pelagibacter sp. HIMB1495]|uniref:glycosyltransferase n=1 Tax=unclassified Candidatus Pelagibacter TaxID=2647897 RepID=UPI003F876F7C
MKINQNLSIIIISFRSREKVIKLVNNISSEIQIVVIDNSEDKKLKKELERFKNIKVFLKRNIGYGAAANFAKTKINTKFFLLCNPDLEDLDNNKIKEFYKIGNRLYPNFLAIGPNYNFNNQLEKFDYEIKKKISGSCMFFNSKKFEMLKGFDENIFLYFEEDDLCKRANKEKIYSYVANFIKINHNIGTSVKSDHIFQRNKLKELTTWHFIWSKFYYYNKHYGKLISVIIFIPTILRIFFKLIFSKLINNKSKFKKYKIRLSGLFSSIIGTKSYKRL